MEAILFYSFSALALLSALFVILLPKPTRALLSLIVTMFALSSLYLLLGAPFLAMVNLIVYAGAILVLFLFVIMLQGVGAKDIPFLSRFHKGHLAMALTVGITFSIAAFSIFKSLKSNAGSDFYGSAEVIGNLLFNSYLLPFELTSILLLIGVFAAVSLAKEDPS